MSDQSLHQSWPKIDLAHLLRQTLCQGHISEEPKENLIAEGSSVELCVSEERACSFILHTYVCSHVHGNSSISGMDDSSRFRETCFKAGEKFVFDGIVFG